VSVAVALQPLENYIGENALVWVPLGLDGASQFTAFPFAGADTTYSVTVTNFKIGSTTTGFTYTVTLFDPAVPGADYFPPRVSGPSQPVVGQNNPYTFTAVSNATGYQWRATRRAPYQLSDGAETGLGNFTVNTSGGYAVRDSALKASGNYSFHLAHPTPPTDQTLTLTQGFVAGTNTLLSFKSRLGYATSAQFAKVQVQTNGASGWVDLFSQPGNDSGFPVETSFTTRTVPLAAYAGLPLRLRFNYAFLGGSYYFQTDPPVGWYLDDIVLTNAEVWTPLATNATATTQFAFNPPQPGLYNLEVRALIFAEFPLDWGPPQTVTATTNLPPLIVMSRPVLTNGQVRLDFTVSGTAATFKLLQADALGAPWTTNTGAALTTNSPGSAYRFTTAVGPARRFYRVQTP